MYRDISCFYTSDGSYQLELAYVKDDFYKEAELFYSNKDGTITGTAQDGVKYKLSLKAGWNFLIFTWNKIEPTGTYTASQTLPSDFKWVVKAK